MLLREWLLLAAHSTPGRTFLAALALSLVASVALASGVKPLKFRTAAFTAEGWDCRLFQPDEGAVKPITVVCR